MENPNMQGMPVSQPKKSNTGLIIGIVVAVLLCCCCILVGGGAAIYYKAQSSVSDIYSSLNEQLTALPNEIPSLQDLTLEPPSFDATSEPGSPNATQPPLNLNIPSDTVPQGGLGDDILRTQAWTYSLLTVAMSGCSVPTAKDTTIEVLEKPDANGVWKERWTVACGDSKTIPVDITFTPSSGGGTDISVTLAK